jgi:phosphate/sulfate permease
LQSSYSHSQNQLRVSLRKQSHRLHHRRRRSAPDLRRPLGRGIVMDWIITMPMSALIAALAYWAAAGVAG